jgi:hypothetical protein
MLVGRVSVESALRQVLASIALLLGPACIYPAELPGLQMRLIEPGVVHRGLRAQEQIDAVFWDKRRLSPRDRGAEVAYEVSLTLNRKEPQDRCIAPWDV